MVVNATAVVVVVVVGGSVVVVVGGSVVVVVEVVVVEVVVVEVVVVAGGGASTVYRAVAVSHGPPEGGQYVADTKWLPSEDPGSGGAVTAALQLVSRVPIAYIVPSNWNVTVSPVGHRRKPVRLKVAVNDAITTP